MNPFVILLGGRDALLARETFLTCIYIYIYIYIHIYLMVCPSLSYEECSTPTSGGALQ